MKINVKKENAGIHGSTVINHHIRAKLDVTAMEYVVLEYVYNRMKEGKKTSIYGEVDDLWKAIGIRPEAFSDYIADLMDLKFIEENNGIAVTDKWINEFADANEDKFEEFWEAYGKVGNKENARKMFLKTIKETTYKHLLIRHADYVKHLSNVTWKGKMHCSTWLNPAFKRYEDDYKAEENEEIKEDKFQL
ncbi:hypothetical protein CMI37_37040 [Candidatus Pacearchaeota archaeon]|nr:hypothetical protein [Candidatus Pacearchaeota archaeon]|tara:strand:+ start:1686 stop:2258 length:573 start_codon:yes stop_codon:yes gene_type:complete